MATASSIVLVLLVIMMMVSLVSMHIFLLAGTIIGVWMIFVLYFFRNPKRTVFMDGNAIYAPADGKIVVKEKVFENEYLLSECIKVSIFMSPLNVHVNRYPITGTVVYEKYHPGKYFIASYPKSSELNEHQSVVIEGENGVRILVKQIAGAMARRVVCYAKVGDRASQGDDLGFIKFGSRVDVFLPSETKILVSLHEKVVGNKTIIATL